MKHCSSGREELLTWGPPQPLGQVTQGELSPGLTPKQRSRRDRRVGRFFLAAEGPLCLLRTPSPALGTRGRGPTGTGGVWAQQGHGGGFPISHTEPGEQRGRTELAQSWGRRVLRVQFSQESLGHSVGDSWKYCSWGHGSAAPDPSRGSSACGRAGSGGTGTRGGVAVAEEPPDTPGVMDVPVGHLALPGQVAHGQLAHPGSIKVSIPE